MKERCLRILDYAGEYSLYGLIFFIPISSAGIEIFFGFILLFYLLKKIIKPDFIFFKSYMHLFLLFFFLFSALSLFNSGYYIIKSFKALFFKWAEYIALFLIVADTLRNSKKRIYICLFILLGVGCLVGIDALSQRFTGIEFLRHKSMVEINKESGLYGVTASFHHYNDFGTYLVFILSLAIALFVSKQKKLYKIALFLLIILLIAGLLLTFSRASWLGFITSLVLMLLISRKFKQLLPILGIFIILLIFIPIAKERAAFTSQYTEGAGRFIIWQSAFRMITERPFLGNGLGTFMDYFHKYTPNLYTQYAHNCFLQIWSESGIFSLLSFLCFIGLLLFKGIKTFRVTNDYFLLGLTCGIFGFLVHSFFDTPLYSLQLATLFWSMLGFVVVLTMVDTSVDR